MDEEHFIYVDSGKDDGGELGRLMHDFRVKEAKEIEKLGRIFLKQLKGSCRKRLGLSNLR